MNNMNNIFHLQGVYQPSQQSIFGQATTQMENRFNIPPQSQPQQASQPKSFHQGMMKIVAKTKAVNQSQDMNYNNRPSNKPFINNKFTNYDQPGKPVNPQEFRANRFRPTMNNPQIQNEIDIDQEGIGPAVIENQNQNQNQNKYQGYVEGMKTLLNKAERSEYVRERKKSKNEGYNYNSTTNKFNSKLNNIGGNNMNTNTNTNTNKYDYDYENKKWSKGKVYFDHTLNEYVREGSKDKKLNRINKSDTKLQPSMNANKTLDKPTNRNPRDKNKKNQPKKENQNKNTNENEINFNPNDENMYFEEEEYPDEYEDIQEDEGDYSDIMFQSDAPEEDDNYIKPLQTKPSPKQSPKKVEEIPNEKKTKIDISKLKQIQDQKKTQSSSLKPETLTPSFSPPTMQKLPLVPLMPKAQTIQWIPVNKDTQSRDGLNAMCSELEMKEREEQNQLDIFELDPELTYFNEETNIWVEKIKPEYAVKCFIRSGGDLNTVDMSNIRTPEALVETTNYLITEIIDSTNSGNQGKFSNMTPITFSRICIFVNNRFKAITKEFKIRKMKYTKEVIQCHEKIARFLIICLNESLNEKEWTSEQGLYKLYLEQLNSILVSLNDFYDAANIEMQLNPSNESVYQSPHEIEFLSYFWWYSLYQQPIEFLSLLSKIPKQFRDSEKIRHVLYLSNIILSNNWVLFMKDMKSSKCDYWTSCLMIVFWSQMRKRALDELCICSVSKNISYKASVNDLVELLCFDNPVECLRFLEWYTIDLKTEVLEGDYEMVFEVKRWKGAEERNMSKIPIMTNYKYIESKKMGKTRCEVVWAGEQVKWKEIISTKGANQPVSKPIISLPPPMKIKENEVVKHEKQVSLFNNEIKTQSLPKEGSKGKDSVDTNMFQGFNNSNSNNNSNFNCLFQSTSNALSFKDFVLKDLRTLSPPHIINTSNIDKEQSTIKQEYLDKTTKYIFGIWSLIWNQQNQQCKIQFISYLHSIRTRGLLYDKMAENFRKRKRYLIFSEIKKNYITSKYDKIYFKECLKYNMNINSLTTQENKVFPYPSSIPDFRLFTYEDLKLAILSKHGSDNQTLRRENEFIHHWQINFYTTKDWLYNSQILQNLSINPNHVQSSNEELILFENEILFNSRKYVLYIKFIFFDQINDIDKYYYDNQKNINKFSIGIICFDILNPSNREYIENFVTLMDLALGKHLKKNFLFLFQLKSSLTDDDISIIEKVYSKLSDSYHIFKHAKRGTPLFIGNINDFTEYHKKPLIAHNNKTMMTLFETHISFISFNLNKALITWRAHNAVVTYNALALKIKSEYMYKYRYNIYIEQILLGAMLCRVVSKYYFNLFNLFSNELHTIPFYISTSHIIKIEDSASIAASWFYDLSKVSFKNDEAFYDVMNQDNHYNQLDCFDYLVKVIIDVLVKHGVNRYDVVKISDEVKGKYINGKEENFIVLVIEFYEILIGLISVSWDVFIDREYEHSVLVKVYETKKEDWLKEMDVIVKRITKDGNRDLNRKYVSCNIWSTHVEGYLYQGWNKENEDNNYNYNNDNDNNNDNNNNNYMRNDYLSRKRERNSEDDVDMDRRGVMKINNKCEVIGEKVVYEINTKKMYSEGIVPYVWKSNIF